MNKKFLTVFLLLSILASYLSVQKKYQVKIQAKEKKTDNSEPYSFRKVLSSSPYMAGIKKDNHLVQNSPYSADREERLPHNRSVYLGMWTEGFWDDIEKVLHPERLRDLEKLINKKVSIAHYYRGWDALDGDHLLLELKMIDSAGWRPMISTNPYFFDRCTSKGLTLYKAIAEGNCDSFLHKVGKIFWRFGQPVFFRFAWEMNLPTIQWGVRNTADSPNDFIQAWRHIHSIVRAEGAYNVLWVFSPNVEYSETTSYESIYPGDEYVDWLGLDGYNWGTTQPWSSWQGFSDVFKTSYNHLISLSPSKPLMLAEVNTTDKGGDKSTWYRDMLSLQIPEHFPKIEAVVFYNEDRTKQENVNWLITLSPSYLEAFKSSIRNNLYKSSFDSQK